MTIAQSHVYPIYSKLSHIETWPLIWIGPNYLSGIQSFLSLFIFIYTYLVNDLHHKILTCSIQIPGGFSHWHGIRICACLLGHFFAKFGIAIGGFHQRRRSPNYINWVYFGQIIVKSTQFDPNWVLFSRKWYTDGWEIWQKIGIEIVRFSRSGRHIHVRFWWKNPPRDTNIDCYEGHSSNYRPKVMSKPWLCLKQSWGYSHGFDITEGL